MRRRRTAVPTAVLLAAGALVALLAYGVVRQGDDTSLDQALGAGSRPQAPAAAVRLPSLDGSRPRALKDFQGRWVLLNVWASWCEPCRAEAPLLQLAERRLRRARAGTVLGVTFDDNRRDARAFAARYGLTFPIVRDVDKRLTDAFGIRAIPETFLIDPEGRVRALRRGAVDRPFVDQAVRLATNT